MLGWAILVEIIIQSIALTVEPTMWLNWQLLGFITATNLGALIIGIAAQKSADDIREQYRSAFTPDFYRTLDMLSALGVLVRTEADKDGKSLDDELADLAPKFYGLARKYIDVRAAEEGITPPEPIIADAPEEYTEDELFSN